MKEREIANLYVFVERYICIYTTLHPTTSLDIDIRLSFCTSICILGWKNIFMMSLSLIFPLALVHDRVDSKPIDATPAVLCVGWSRLFVKRENVYPYFTHSLSLSSSLPPSLGSHLNRRSDNDDDSFRALSFVWASPRKKWDELFSKEEKLCKP